MSQVLVKQLGDIGQVEAPVQGCDVRDSQASRYRKMQRGDMKVDHVELVGEFCDTFDHQEMQRNRVSGLVTQPERSIGERYQAGARARVARGEERHLMT